MLLHPREYHPWVAINQLPGCQAERVAAFWGHSTCRDESNTNPEGQPALASPFQKQVGRPGGRRVGSQLPALSAGKSCTGHLARSRWMYMLCSHWRCWHSSGSPERSHALLFQVLTSATPLGNAASVMFWERPSTPPPWGRSPAPYLQRRQSTYSGSCPATCPQFKLSRGWGMFWARDGTWDMDETPWCDYPSSVYSLWNCSHVLVSKHPSSRHTGNEWCLVWMCIYLLSLLHDNKLIEGPNLSSVLKNNEELFLLLPFCIRPDKAIDILKWCFSLLILLAINLSY